MARTPKRLAVLASGGGSNLQAISDHLDDLGTSASAELALVLSDRADSGALARARNRGIQAQHIAGDHSQTIPGLLEEYGIDLIALAGYMKLIPENVVSAFSSKMINIHPALLPSFGGKGMFGQRVHKAVIDSGARVSGPTVHFVTENFDEGAIIAQWPVPVRVDDTPSTLGARVLAVEHRMYPWAVEAVASGQISLGNDGRARGVPEFDFDLFAPEPRRHPFVR